MISFGNRIEMLVDEFFLESKNGVSFRYTKPENLGKAIGFDRVWEDRGSLL